MIIYYSTYIRDLLILLKDDEHRHCSKVTRRSVGDKIYVTDGHGHLYHCIIEHMDRHETSLTICDKEVLEPPSYRLGIAIAPTKNNTRLEWFIEKATEIGISDIYPIITNRGEKKNIKIDRLEKILISAMKQSKNLYKPTIHPIMDLDALLKQSEVYDLKCVAHCADVEKHLSRSITTHTKSVLVAIGPEGDFTGPEIDLLTQNNFVEVNLGKSRLRTETAGIVAAQIVASSKI